MADQPARSRVDARTRTVGIIGWPVEHSLSPLIHNTAFVALEMNWVYVPIPVPPGELSAALAGLAALGFVGANVTMPHKTEAAAVADEVSEDARRLNAVNTLVVNAGGLAGHNTDAPGFDRFLRRDAGFDASGRRALLFGAGGAARACALALARAGLAHLTVALREPARAAALLATLDGLDPDVAVVQMADAGGSEVDLVINATPLGTHDEELPLPPLGPESLVVDLLYRPAVTPMQRAAREAGAAAFGGLGLLLHQAALSFELWTGREPPLDAMSAAALAELA
ncbi:MAG TPA: shikimate dehydrogenase [Actinomycetota bacterium]|nr:shikimate dehydrogenase [Actinomycetota bacterium]